MAQSNEPSTKWPPINIHVYGNSSMVPIGLFSFVLPFLSIVNCKLWLDYQSDPHSHAPEDLGQVSIPAPTPDYMLTLRESQIQRLVGQ